MEMVTAKLGDSTLPSGSLTAGSMSTGSRNRNGDLLITSQLLYQL